MSSVPAVPRRRVSIDGLLVGAALLFGSATLLYPFGGDQGLYYYVGREWSRGAVPYRDAMEQKTPLVFLLHAVLVLLTGPNMWAIRAAELAFVLLLGWVLAELVTPPGQPRQPGVLGVACLSLAVLYFGLFNYWDTAQCEIWYAGLSLLSLWAVTRPELGPGAWRRGGLLGGLAWLMKPPAALLLLVPITALALRVRRAAGGPGGRAWRRAGLAVLAYAGWASLPLAVTALYFGAVGGLDDLVEQAFLANYHDMRHSATVFDLGDVLSRTLDFFQRAAPLAPLAVAALLVRPAATLWRTRRLEPPAVTSLALFLAGWCAVALQRKFYGYHWGVLAPVLALALAALTHEIVASGRGRLRTWAPVLVGALVVAAGLASEPGRDYARLAALAARYVGGQATRAEFLAPFSMDGNTPYAQQELVGLWLAAHTAPHERVAVRGFEQVVYAVCDRRAPTRFFWTRWLTEPRRVYRRREWLAEDRAALERDPPRYAVVSAQARKGPASRRYFTRLGYVERLRHGRLVVLEAPTPRPAGSS